MHAPLFHQDELKDRESRGFLFRERAIFAVRQNGHIYLYENRCPHRGVTLEWVEHQFLDSSRTLIQCATHGALFLPDSGQCITGPCIGQTLLPVAFRIVDGWIHIQPSGSETRA